MGRVEWKLREYLKARDILPRDVEREAIRLGYRFGQNTIYRLLKGQGPKRLDRNSLAAVLDALYQLTGEDISVADIVHFEPSPPPGEPKREDQVWLEAGLEDQVRRLAELEADVPPEELKAWQEAMARAAKPVRWDPQRGEFVAAP